VVVRKVQEAELDEMWSFVGCKRRPRWLWQVLEHQTGRVVAYVFGRREDQALLPLKALLARSAFAVFTLAAGVRSAGTWIHTGM
jgi:IS1 family transposase